MDLLVYITAAMLIITKFFDALTTHRRIRHTADEQNPLARRLMLRIGKGNAIWLIFFIAVVIVVLSLWLLYEKHHSFIWRSAYVLVGILISVVQASVAWANHVGKQNLITRWLLRHFMKGSASGIRRSG
jgi:4-hydroxybenzoate polyprenyltransferase